MKRKISLCLVIILVVLLAAGSPEVNAADLNDGTNGFTEVFTGDRYHEITASEADNLFNSGKSFILLYYSHQCGLTLSRAAMFQQLMDDYDVHIYGINGVYQSAPRWMWDKFNRSISYPVVCTVINKQDYSCLDGGYSLSEQVLQISDYLQKTEDIQLDNAIWQGFYELNSAMYNKARKDQEALNNYLVSTEYIQANDPEIVSLSKEITDGYSDDYKKLKAIHDWVSDNIVYDLHTFRYAIDDYYEISDKDFSAKGTLKTKLSVCAGYANLTAALARSAGIPCKVVTGFADGRPTANLFHELFSLYKNYLNTRDEKIFSEIRSNHAWNEAYVNGRWVILDTTWDSNNEYLDGETKKSKSSDKYFDIDLKIFSETHAYWESEFFDYIPDEPLDDERDGGNAYRVNTAFEAQTNSVSRFFPEWNSTIRSYLIDNEDGTMIILEAKENTVTIEKYDKQFSLLSQKSIAFELPIFGGFYSGEKYNYIAYGQINEEEKDDKEVIRIVRYDKAFRRVDSVSVRDCFTVVPFKAGSGKMAEYGATLVFHTSRLRYTTEDGNRHQSQLTLIIDTENMCVTNYLGEYQSNHVSHSFDQYVQFDGNDHVLVDHGDAYPRSVVLHKSGYITHRGADYREVDLFTIPGEIGDNFTGVSIGDFEISSDNYIVAMNTIDFSLGTKYTDFAMKGIAFDRQRDILICALPKNKFNSKHVKQTMLARYTGSEKIGSIPQLVKVSDNRLMVLWQEFDIDGQPEVVKYVFIDENGEVCSDVKTLENFRLSECKPIVIGNSVVWYTNENGERYFYTISLTDAGSDSKATKVTKVEVTQEEVTKEEVTQVEVPQEEVPRQGSDTDVISEQPTSTEPEQNDSEELEESYGSFIGEIPVRNLKYELRDGDTHGNSPEGFVGYTWVSFDFVLSSIPQKLAHEIKSCKIWTWRETPFTEEEAVFLCRQAAQIWGEEDLTDKEGIKGCKGAGFPTYQDDIGKQFHVLLVATDSLGAAIGYCIVDVKVPELQN